MSILTEYLLHIPACAKPCALQEFRILSCRRYRDTWNHSVVIIAINQNYTLAPDVKSWLTGKDPDAGKDWRQMEKALAENEKVRQQHWLNWHQFSSVQFRCSVVSHSLRIHGRQHAKLPCPSLTPGCEFEQALGVGDGQESMACCSPWGHKRAWVDWAHMYTQCRREMEMRLVHRLSWY